MSRGVNNDKFWYLWDLQDHCGSMVDCRFLKGNGLKFYHLQYQWLRQFSNWVTALHTRVYRCSETWTTPSWVISGPPRPLPNYGWRSFSKGPWPELIPPAIWLLRGASYRYCVLRYIPFLRHEQRKFGVSLKHHRQLQLYDWWSFSYTHGLKLYQLQYQCLGLLSIWTLSLYTRVYRCYKTGTMTN